MDIDLEELVETWLLYHAPFVLQDPELVTQLLRFIHALMRRVAQEERRQTMLRVLRVYPSCTIPPDLG